MSEYFNIESVTWQPVRPEITKGVYGRLFLEKNFKMMLVRVTAGGGFSSHRDSYGHLFYFLSGEGVVRVENQKFSAGPGTVVRVETGETHSYDNTGPSDLVLISLNLPKE